MRCCPACSSKRLRTRLNLPSFLSNTGPLGHQNSSCWMIFKPRWQRCKPPTKTTHHRLKERNGIIRASSKPPVMD